MMTPNTILLEAAWDDIVKVFDFGLDKNKTLSFMIRLSHMKTIHIFKNLPEETLVKICKRMNKIYYDENQIVFEEGSNGDYLYILYKGKVLAFKGDKFLRELEDGNCFGETSLILNEKHSATIVTSQKSTIFILSKEDFHDLIDKNLHDFLVKKISLQDNFSTNLKDLNFIKHLGEGKFGYVSLVHNGKNIFAIKVVNRKAANKQRILIKYFIKERQILLSLDHQFIVKLVKTMKNDEFIFYLMEYVNGTPLSNYLNLKIKRNRKYESQFFIATLLVIIDYLNSKKIAHRDIKPDNIMIDENGYLKMIDFGTAVILRDFTNTIVGTPHYIAPEILVGKGYGFTADYWSIGITAYEIYFGYYPFGQKAHDPMAVYKEVVKKYIKIR
jgi:cGMP-dependent protein kinase